MALTFPRWLVIVALACGAAAVALLPPPPRNESRLFSPIESSRLQRLNGQLDRARKELTIVRLGETVIEMIRQNPLPAGGVPTVLDPGAATEEQRVAFLDRLLTWWPKVALNDSIAVGIVLGGDSAEPVWRDQHLLPASLDGRSCVTLVPTVTWVQALRLSANDLQRRFATELGPCLFFGMYGRPGAAVERWIGGKGLDFATYFNPSGRRFFTADHLPDESQPTFLLLDMVWSIYGTTPRGIQCLNGRTEMCALAVNATDTMARPNPSRFRAPSDPWRRPFGSLTGSFLADLHQKVGSERFRQFWNSTGTLDQAFQAATGLDLGEWTHQWAVGRRGAFRPGPLPERRSVARIAGLTLLLLGIAVVYSTRRTAG